MRMTEHLLIVEDDPDIAMLLEMRLRRQGYEVQRAADGAEGLAIHHASHPPVILTDRAMPVLDGIGMTRSIRSSVGAQPRIIMVSASTTAIDQYEAREAGVDDYVTKPIAFPLLLEAVKRSFAALDAAAPSTCASQDSPDRLEQSA
jgi:DNA-binding response OmpR family regulator